MITIEGRLHLGHLPLLGLLPLLEGKVELVAVALGSLGLEGVGKPVEDLEEIVINGDNLIVFLGDTVLEDVVFVHDPAKELRVEGVDDVEHVLAVALVEWILREVLHQLL